MGMHVISAVTECPILRRVTHAWGLMLYNHHPEIQINFSLNLCFVRAIQWDKGICSRGLEPLLTGNPTFYHLRSSQGTGRWPPAPASPGNC